MSHTKGPWTVDQRCIQAPDGNIALLNLARPERETQANAKLIAQAPLLPEAIEALRGTVEALGALLEDERYTLAVGGNPNAVTEMLAAASKALSEARAIIQRYEEEK